MNIKQLKQLPKVSQRAFGPAAPQTTFQNLSDAQVNATRLTAAAANEAPDLQGAGLQEQINALAERRAQEIIREQQQARILARNGRTFTRFDAVNDVIDNQTEVVTAGLWSDGIANLVTHHTSSAQTTSQRRYYVDVYQKDAALSGSAVQYSIAYGHALGSGSDSQGQLNDSPSRAVYSQYKQLLLETTDTRFTVNGVNTNSIYVINFSRARTKEKLDPGNFELPLTSISSRDTNATGSVVTGSDVFTLIDDSGNSGAPAVGSSGRLYNIVSGSINDGIYNPDSPVYYGLVYPDYGIMVLNAQTLDANLGFTTNTGSSSEGNNHFALFHSISGSGVLTNPATSDPYGFQARNAETITSAHYFVRIKNAEYNFSNNPSFTTGSVGEFAQSTFVGDPKVYITTIGMYNDQRELLAVAKLSQPLLKSFKNEALIRVKLDF